MGKLYCTVLFLLWFRLGAQDPIFSDYSALQPLLNPALTGFMSEESTQRISAVGRSQWYSFLESAAYRTIAAGYDTRICGITEGDFIGLGLNVSADRHGQPALSRIDATFTAAYTKWLGSRKGRGSFVSLGAEIGMIQYSLDATELTFDDQFDNPGLAPERVALDRLMRLNYGVGIQFAYISDGEGSFSANGGLAIKHLNKPSVTLVDDGLPATMASDSSARLNTRWSPHVGFSIPTGQKSAIQLTGQFHYQRPHNQALIHALFDLTTPLGNNAPISSFGFGAGFRMSRGFSGLGSDALVTTLRVGSDRFRLGVNYDINVSSLHASTQGAGAVEISLTTVFGGEKGDCIFCPTF